MPFGSDIKRLARQFFAPGNALRAKYLRFKALLAADDLALERIADLQETFYGIRPADPVRVLRLNCELRSAVEDMAENLQAMCPLRYQSLSERIAGIGEAAGGLLRLPEGDSAPPYVVSLEEGAGRPDLSGGKATNLGRLAHGTSLSVPPGLVVTTRAFQLFIERNGLRKKLDAILGEALLCRHTRFSRQCREMREMVLGAAVPDEAAKAIHDGVSSLFPCRAGSPPALAVRSSAWAEDGAFSFAGQYDTVLDVDSSDIERAWLEVVASKYSARAVTYRILRGLSDVGTPMGVLILPMIDARAAGVAHSRDLNGEGGAGVSVHAVNGLGVSLVDGSAEGEVFHLTRDDCPRVVSCSGHPSVLSAEEAERVAAAALESERFFGTPQDVEWCLDRAGAVHVVQSRPFNVEKRTEEISGPSDFVPGVEPLLDGLTPVSAGAGSGRILHLHDAQDPAEAPRGSVVVFETLAPNLTRCLDRVEAVIGASGGRAGHFAAVAREFGIPVVVGVPSDTAELDEGTLVTVDGASGRVYPGRLDELVESAEATRKRAREASLHQYEELVPLVTALNLTDPDREDFTPEGCSSMHDLIRYIHEKGVAEMFDLVGKSGRGMSRSRRLLTDLPLTMYVLPLDVEFPGSRRDGVRPEDVRSVPMRMVWDGLESRETRWESTLHHMDWEEMDRVSAGIFSKEARFLSSYALAAADYMHMMIRFGYHFSILDSVCGPESKNNYVRFRFKGGGADFDGRLLRLGFIDRVLRACGFAVEVKSDMLDAVLSRRGEGFTRHGLRVLGQLMAETRLMDMRLSDISEVEDMVESFLAEMEQMPDAESPS